MLDFVFGKTLALGEAFMGSWLSIEMLKEDQATLQTCLNSCQKIDKIEMNMKLSSVEHNKIGILFFLNVVEIVVSVEQTVFDELVH